MVDIFPLVIYVRYGCIMYVDCGVCIIYAETENKHDKKQVSAKKQKQHDYFVRGVDDGSRDKDDFYTCLYNNAFRGSWGFSHDKYYVFLMCG